MSMTTDPQRSEESAPTPAVIPPDVALPLIRHRLDTARRNLTEMSFVDRILLGAIRDLVDVVEQLAEQIEAKP